MTARELCTAVLVYLGVIAANETPDAADINRVFDDLNDFMDSLSTDSYMIYNEVDETFSLVSGTSSYTIGSTGVFSTIRPGSIQRAWVRLNSVDYPLIPINNQQYNLIGMKAITNTIPEFFYYNPTFPNGTLKVWPVPSQSMTINITSLKQFVRFASLDTTVSLPVGYARMLKWNLISEVSEAFGKQPTETILRKASKSKADLQRLNSPPVKMGFDSQLSGRAGSRYNIYTDGLL